MWAATLFAALCGPLAVSQEKAPEPITGTQRAELLKQAAAKYYHIDRATIQSFTCNVQPNWDTLQWDKVVAPTLDAPSTYSDLIGKLRKAPPPSFTFTLGQTFNATTDLSFPDAPGVTAAEKDTADGLQGIFVTILTGYLKIWGVFFNGHLIDHDPDSVSRTPAGYLIYSDLGGSGASGGKPTQAHDNDVLDKDLVLVSSDMDMVSDGMEVITKPTFTPSASGLLLTGEEMTTKVSAASTSVTSTISYASGFTPVDTSMLPTGFTSVTVINTNGKSGKLATDMTFSGCTLKKKP